jgi:hypothetical protein
MHQENEVNNMPVDVGDAVFKFLGDSTSLDAQFNQIGPKAQAAFEPAAEAGEDAMGRIKSATAEARGEVALLGEEFGIHLPRHVRSFVAELPGLGNLLSTAFSATAVLFLAQAVAQAADKLSTFVGSTLINTKTMQEANAEIIASNQELAKLSTQYDEAKKRLESLTEGPLQKLAAEEERLTKAFRDNEEAAKANQTLQVTTKSTWDKVKDGVHDAGVALLGFTTGIQLATAAENDYTAALGKQQNETNRIYAQRRQLDEEQKAHNEELRQTRIKESLEALENQEKIAVASATEEENIFEIKQYYSQRKLQLVKEYGAKEKQQADALAADIEASQIQHALKVENTYRNLMGHVLELQHQALNALQTSDVKQSPFTEAEQAMLRFDKAAAALGLTLREDLVNSLNQAKEAENAFISAGFKQEGPVWQQIEAAIKKADDALKNFGKSEDSFLAKSKAWKEFQQQIEGAEHGVDQLKITGAQAFDSLEGNIAGAFQQIVLGQGNVAKALAKTTAESLAQLASQAAVKALFYTAEGFAALAGFNGGSASEFFTAAGEMAAVAVAAGAAGRAMSGLGGGTSTNTQQSHNSVSNTGSQSGTSASVSGVQQFAAGGLISAPTLAIMGEESKREAVLPLTDDRAMSAIAEAIGKHGGGGMNVNVGGLVSDDNLQRICKRINKLVMRGQTTLVSSDSLRVTKRSA